VPIDDRLVKVLDEYDLNEIIDIDLVRNVYISAGHPYHLGEGNIKDDRSVVGRPVPSHIVGPRMTLCPYVLVAVG
jgi:hypothetical protein